MAIFSPYQGLAFHKSHCLSVHVKKRPVFVDQSTHSLYYFGLYSQNSIKVLFMLKESRPVLQVMSYNLFHFLCFQFPPQEAVTWE